MCSVLIDFVAAIVCFAALLFITLESDGLCGVFFFKQKTAYEMRISDWSSDVCSSDLPTSLREYDIRGIVGKTLGMEDAKAIGRTFGTMIRRAGGSKVATGYDGRVSSPMLEAGVIEGLNEAGVDAVSVGLGPTPMLYYAAATLGVDGGIMVTGSHNPPEYNGFKMEIGRAHV